MNVPTLQNSPNAVQPLPYTWASRARGEIQQTLRKHGWRLHEVTTHPFRGFDELVWTPPPWHPAADRYGVLLNCGYYDFPMITVIGESGAFTCVAICDLEEFLIDAANDNP
jgi:hypothetical protein